MFKVGDRVVCVNNSNATNLYNLNQVYIIEGILDYGDGKFGVKTKNRIFTNSNRFLPLQDYRKLKLEKLNENL